MVPVCAELALWDWFLIREQMATNRASNAWLKGRWLSTLSMGEELRGYFKWVSALVHSGGLHDALVLWDFCLSTIKAALSQFYS